MALLSGRLYGAIARDVTVSKDGSAASATITSPAFSTAGTNEQLLAFISTDFLTGVNTTVKSVTGGSLTWTLIKRTNAQSGSAEIWGAFAPTALTGASVTGTLSQSVISSITVMSFTGVNVGGAIGAAGTKSAATGAPTASLVTTGANSWVIGVGNDFSNATARTLGTGQTLIHQDLTPTGDTYWVQMLTSAVALAGTTATINDTAPTKDSFNLSIVELLVATSVAPTYTISGTVTPASSGAGSTVSLTGASSATALADASGNYSFSGLVNGSYTLTPSKTGYMFTPASQSVTVSGANQSAANFIAQAIPTWSISGTLSPTPGGAGASVALTGPSSATTTADANGNYSFSGLSNGTYKVTPSKVGYTFAPSNQSVVVSGANQASVNFTAQAIATWSITGTISPVAGGVGATVALSGPSSATTVTDGSGNYVFTGLANGTYTVTPINAGYSFTPISKSVALSGASQDGVNFTAQEAATYSISGAISPAAAGSGATITLSGASSSTKNADANGNYSFTQLANGTYQVTPSQSGYVIVPTSRSVTLSGASMSSINFTASAGSPSIARDVTALQDGSAASATITSPVFSTASGSEQLLAFISADFITGTNTTVKSISGAGLTWTLIKRANAQSGTAEIWGAFASSKLTAVSVTATLSQSVISSIAVMTFSGVNPAGAIGATGSKSASTGAPSASLVTTGANSWVLGVGNDYSKAVARTIGAGQILLHQALTSTGDTYWVQMLSSAVSASGSTVTISDTAPTTDSFNLSIVELLAASGSSGATAPTISMASPAPGATVAGLLGLTASASDAVGVVGVQFLLDGSTLGTELTTAPYSLTWDSTTVAMGSHTLAARARNGAGLSTTSTGVSVIVSDPTNTAVVGQWSSPIALPAVAVNLVLLRNNQVLFYQDGSTASVWNYVQNTFNSVPRPENLFCSGHALLADGRVLVVGGYGNSSNTIGITNAEIFDPSSQSWTAVPNMQYRRWYPTATTLSDGRILVTAGWQTSAHTNAGISEIYDSASNSWTQLTNANNPFETYPFLYLLPDGRILHIGGSEYPTDTDVLDLNTVNWSVVDPEIVDGGSATMYLPNKFMKAGSASDSQDVGPSSSTTYVLDMTQANPAWMQIPSMVYPRSYMNLTMLPDGTALATGGETDRNGGDISKAVYAAELWSPQSKTWSTMSAMHTPREYHGTALLLPDARVLVSGMGADFGNVPDEKSAEFYSPPYLFKGARPVITQAPAQVQYNMTFSVTTPDSATISKVVLIRTGAVTHFFDENERYIPLSFTQANGGLTVTAPVDANMAPPGYYMLFIVNSNGVPSVAPFVQLP